MTDTTKDPGIVKLPNVRLSFPHLWKPHAMEEGQEPKFSAVFLFDNNEHGTLLDQIDELINRLALNEFKKKVGFKRCLRDGNEKSELEGYGDGKSFLTASSKARPGIVDRVLNPITEEKNIIYAGCYVNATIRLWVQNNNWGKRVNAQLRAVQFVKDGESFGAGPVDATQEFDSLDEANTAAQEASNSARSRSGGSPGRSGGSKGSNLDEF